MSGRISAGLLAPLALALLWPAAAAAAPTHVACVGDSITYGYLASSPSASYPSDLQKMLGSSVSVMNFGHSGATLLSTGDTPYQKQSEYTAATSFVSGAGASARVAVVIMLGTNDSKPGNWMSGTSTRATQFQTDAAALVDHFAQLSTHPTIYLAIPPRVYTNTFGIDDGVLQDQIDPILRAVASAKGLATIDVAAPTTGHPELFSDGVHPTDAGYTLLAMIVHDALASAGNGAGGAGGGGSGAGGRPGSGGAGGSGPGHGGTGAGGKQGAGGSDTGGSGTGGAGTGGRGTGGAGTGGASTGGSPAVATGGAGSGGRSGSGGQNAAASGGATSGSGGTSGGTGGASSGSGGAPAVATGGSPAGGGEANGSGGCACALGAGAADGDHRLPGTTLLFGALLALRARRRRG